MYFGGVFCVSLQTRKRSVSKDLILTLQEHTGNLFE